ncbi:TetR/AcrR family transcriptional regulator [Microbacterium sp. RD1]|uniref:TetR/AcrR family transcriptional regulator n=1 Tax=Microbacterium sp. RD1 TaxID=3457313 RepID=UPI003FA614C0
MTPDPVADAARRMSSDERREQIIEAAIAVFGAKGYVGTTTDDVARAAAVSQPYVVRLFGTKEKLFLAAIGDALDRLFAAFAAVPPSGDQAERARAMGAAYVGLLEVRGLHQILSHAFLLGAHPVIGPAARAGFARVWRYLLAEGFPAADAQQFLAQGMMINTLIGLRVAEDYDSDDQIRSLMNECFAANVDVALAQAPRISEPW